jgi:hypothetical protein
MKAKGDYQDQVHSGQMVLVLVRPGGGQHEWWPKATQGGPSGLSPLRSDGSRDGKAGRLDCMSGGQKTLKLSYINLKGGILGLSPLRSDGLMVVRQGSWPKTLKRKEVK